MSFVTPRGHELSTEALPMKMGQLDVRSGPFRFAIARLGSCVGVLMLDSTANVAGCACVMLPRSAFGAEQELQGKFADTAVETLLARMLSMGALEGQISAAVVGGSSMFGMANSNNGLDPGAKLSQAVLAELEHKGIPCVATDIGGHTVRNVVLDVATGAVVVDSAEKGASVLCTLRGQ